MKYPLNLTAILLSSVLFVGCSKDDIEGTDDGSATGGTTNGITISNSTITSGTAEGNTAKGEDSEDLIANSTFSTTVKIVFGSTVTITNPLENAGVTITQSNGDVVVQSTVSEGAYELSGTTTNGSVKFYSEKKFKLVLNGVSITNNDGPAINIQSGKRVFVVVNDNTTNNLTDATTYAANATEDQKGTLFSEGQLIFSGNGTLNVAGKNKHGIVSDDYIRFIAGTYNVTEAASDAIHANDYIIVDNGTFNIKATSDGIEADEGHIIINDGNFTINVLDDGIAASYDTDTTIDPYVVINGGTFNITTTEGEGIESKSTLTINNGTIIINAYDDAINAGKAIYINGGKIYAKSSSNDGIDSNGTLTVSGGYVIAMGARQPETGFDCDNNTFKITGGLLLGLGGGSSTPTSGVSTQNAAVVTASVTANSLLHIRDADNNEVITFLAPAAATTVLYSSAKLTIGKAYNIYTGGSVNNTTDFNGLYLSGNYTGGSLLKTVTQSAKITTTR